MLFWPIDLAALSHGERMAFYYGFHLLSLAGLVLCAAAVGPDSGLRRRKAGCFAGTAYILLYLLMWGWTGLGRAVGLETALVSSRAALLVPLAVVSISRVFDVSLGAGCDLAAPCLYLARAIGKVGCVFPGCCHGRPCVWGIYSAVARMRCFPLQLLEAAGSLAVAAAVLWYGNRRSHPRDGSAYVFSLVLFGCFLFVMEFLNTSDRVLLQMTVDSFFAIAMVLAGLVGLYLIGKRRDCGQRAPLAGGPPKGESARGGNRQP